MKTSQKCARIAGLVILLTVGVTGFAQNQSRGTWTAEVRSEDSQKLQLNIHRHEDHGQFGQSFALNELSGLDPAAVSGTNVPVKFELRHDAGDLRFTGEFDRGLGHGEYTFTANQEYISAMKQIGYSEADQKVFELAVLDVSRPFVKEIRDLGYKASLDELIQARIFKVGRQQVEGLKSVGFNNLPLHTLVE